MQQHTPGSQNIQNGSNGQSHFSPQGVAVRSESANELTDYWQVIVGHRWIILAITAIGVMCSVVYLSVLPNLYTAEVQILVERVDKEPAYQDVRMPSFSGEEDYYGTQIAILTGRKIGKIVASELKLTGGDYTVGAQRLRGTRIIVLGIKHRNPQMAANIANKYAEVFLRENMRDSLFVSEQLLKLLPQDSSHPDSSKDTRRDYIESLGVTAGDSVSQTLNSEKMAIESQIRENSQHYKPQHPIMKELRERLLHLQDEIDGRARKVIDRLKANFSGQYQITNIKILQEAVPSSVPSEPNRVRGVFMGFMLGLGLGVFVVLLTEYANQKIRSEEDLDFSMGTPFLGYIPFEKELITSKKDHSGSASSGQAPLLSVVKKNGELRDAMTSVRTRVLFSMPYERSKRILVTSAVPDEGKSTAALLLALSLASTGEKILLIDADMRRPFLHRYLQIKNKKGLTNLLIGAAALDEVICPIEGTSLSVVTAGEKSPNPVELLESKRFEDLLNEAAPHFDRIVIDIAPVLFIPDGMILARVVDQAILICGAGMSHKKVVRAVIEKFVTINRPFMGIIINRADFEFGAYSYKYKYYQSYKSYYKHQPEALVESR